MRRNYVKFAALFFFTILIIKVLLASILLIFFLFDKSNRYWNFIKFILQIYITICDISVCIII